MYAKSRLSQWTAWLRLADRNYLDSRHEYRIIPSGIISRKMDISLNTDCPKTVSLAARKLLMKAQTRAFTLLELLVVIVTVAILGAMLLPALASTRGNSQKITCLNNLKQVGMAFRTWEGNHNGKYPMAVAKTSGGASDYLAHSSSTPPSINAPASNFYVPGMAYMVMSNELAATKILFCPSDNIHPGSATNFTYQDLLGLSSSIVNQSEPGENGSAFTKISYFVNADAQEANPQDVMTGDDNIGNAGVSSATAAASYRFGGSSFSEAITTASSSTCVGLTSVAWAGSSWWSWTTYDFHQKSGDVGMADGSCQSLTISGLHYYLNYSTNSAPDEAFNFMP